MLLRRSASEPPGPAPDGSAQALDHMANWVRFADTKATILTAGLGVALTMFVGNVANIVSAIRQTCVSGLTVGALALATFVAFLWTLFWLIRAIGPRRKVSYPQPNRFSWPSLTRVTTEELTRHASTTPASVDAWQQVIDLSQLANQKFGACEKAVYGFGSLILLGVACVATAVILTP